MCMLKEGLSEGHGPCLPRSVLQGTMLRGKVYELIQVPNSGGAQSGRLSPRSQIGGHSRTAVGP